MNNFTRLLETKPGSVARKAVRERRKKGQFKTTQDLKDRVSSSIGKLAKRRVGKRIRPKGK